jgi:SAM-dependent methyltransferase
MASEEVRDLTATARIAYGACPLCDGTRLAEERIGYCGRHALYRPGLPETQRWLRCADCGHVFTDGYFTAEALAVIFGGTLDVQLPGVDVEATRPIAARMVEYVESLTRVPGGAWLDVGFGNGALMTTAAEFGWRVVGLDARASTVESMRNLGYDALCSDFTDYHPPERFDVITMADVLEHMPFPRPALARAWDLLEDHGTLFLSMPNSDCFAWKWLSAHDLNPYWGEIEHYHNFGRARLYELLAEHGFNPLRYRISERYRACMEVLARKVPVPR